MPVVFQSQHQDGDNKKVNANTIADDSLGITKPHSPNVSGDASGGKSVEDVAAAVTQQHTRSTQTDVSTDLELLIHHPLGLCVIKHFMYRCPCFTSATGN